MEDLVSMPRRASTSFYRSKRTAEETDMWNRFQCPEGLVLRSIQEIVMDFIDAVIKFQCPEGLVLRSIST